MTITEFLTARYDEDEAVARAAHVETVLPTMWRPELLGQGPFMEHIVRFDPARILADIAAKRAIVAAHPMEYLDAWGVSVCTTCSSDLNPTWAEGGGPCDTLRLLAQPYAEHPDYDPDWRVA